MCEEAIGPEWGLMASGGEAVSVVPCVYDCGASPLIDLALVIARD